MQIANLAAYRRTVERIRRTWPLFLKNRDAWLEQQRRFGVASEKVAENILENLFTEVLDWTVADLNNQVRYSDLLLTRLGIKYLLIEVKRPGALAWNRVAVQAALEQALRYASEQKVRSVAVSDAVMLYAADIEHGGLRDRVYVSLQSPEPPEHLWWLSVHGIYRPCEITVCVPPSLPDAPPTAEAAIAATPEDQLLHPKYKVPARCFAYVGDPCDPATWKLPYRLVDGSIDLERLPKAVQAILTNYRGARISSVPEKDIPDVLVRLAQGAASIGRMPQQSAATAAVYMQLAEVLEQLGRQEEVIGAI